MVCSVVCMQYSTLRSNQPLVPFNPEVQRIGRPTPYPFPNPPAAEMADEHQLFGLFGTPGSQEFEGGVVLPIAGTPYQIKPQFTRMVKESTFSGLKNECPFEHLEAFSDIYGLIPPCPNSPNYVRLHLFHLSLVADAKDWYKCIEPSSITT